METVVFPKSVNENIWRHHLNIYSQTLLDYSQNVFETLPSQFSDVPVNEVYICPLCATNYFLNTKQGIQGSSEFSLDHVPPESLGGKFTVLTCKKCNNDFGHFEAELLKVINIGSAKDNIDQFFIDRVKVINKTTGEYLDGSVHINNEKADIRFNEKAKIFNSKFIDYLSALHNGKIPNITLEISAPNYSKIEKALLKSAYLICFIWWGFEFVFSKNGELIRQVLNNHLDYPTPVPTIWRDTKEGELLKGISILCDDISRLAFMVNIELSGIQNTCTASVLIPNPTEHGWSDLSELNKRLKDPFEVNCITLPRIMHRKGYTISWILQLPEIEKGNNTVCR
jgi:hypothetical protein